MFSIIACRNNGIYATSIDRPRRLLSIDNLCFKISTQIDRSVRLAFMCVCIYYLELYTKWKIKVESFDQQFAFRRMCYAYVIVQAGPKIDLIGRNY